MQMSQDYTTFIENVKRKTGIDLHYYKEAQMKRRLTSLYEKKGYRSFGAFFEAISESPELMGEFLDRMTINVTEFYRNSGRWKVLEDKILPRLLSERPKLNIWSAACSTGEEPYTIAMILAKFLPLASISITASDIDENALDFAKVGLYPERSFNEMPTPVREKYFIQEGAFYKLDDRVKRTVSFKKQNLLLDTFQTGLDLIVCRNVLIYFTEEAKDLLYRKFSSALRPGGVLFVGSTEQIFNASEYGFEVEDTFFYRKKA